MDLVRSFLRECGQNSQRAVDTAQELTYEIVLSSRQVCVRNCVGAGLSRQSSSSSGDSGATFHVNYRGGGR